MGGGGVGVGADGDYRGGGVFCCLTFCGLSRRGLGLGAGFVVVHVVRGGKDGGGAGVDAGCCVDVLGELLGDFEGVARGLEAGAGDDEFGAAYVDGALDDAGEVIGVSRLAVVVAAEDGVGEVDSDLLSHVSEWSM